MKISFTTHGLGTCKAAGAKRLPWKNMSKLFVLCILLFAGQTGWAQTLAGWEVTTTGASGASGSNPFGATTSDANVTVGGLTRPGGGSAAGTSWGVSGFDQSDEADAISNGEYITFSITPNSGHTASISGFGAYHVRRSGTGSSTGIFQYAVGSGSFTDIGSAITWGSVTSATGNSESAVTLSGISDLQNIPAGTTVTFRIVLWGASSLGNWEINNQTGNDFTVTGTTAVATAGPTKLAITNITTQTAGTGFDVTVTSEDGTNTPVNTTASTPITLTSTGTAGMVTTTTPGTITSGTNSVVIHNVTFPNAGATTITAAATGLTSATSNSFNVTGAPLAITNAATAVTSTGATLNGSITANGLSTTASFEYGLNTSYGHTATATQSPVAAGYTATATSAAITALAPNTIYHYRADAVNATTATVTNGADLTFTTLSNTPNAPTASNSQLTSIDITIDNTTANGNPVGTQYIIQETTTGNYVQGNNMNLGSTATALTVNAYPTTFTVTGLTPATGYVFHVLAVSSANGTNTPYGFTTDGITASNNTITTGTLATSLCTGAAVNVPFTYSTAANFTGSNFTAQLSDANGSFASPTTIGTIASNASGTQTIAATFPANTTDGTGYLVRVISDVPAVIGAATASNIAVSGVATTIALATAQNDTVDVNGAVLTVTTDNNATGTVWQYATISGGPYTTISGQTGTTYIPNFTTPGTYYVVATTTYGNPCSITTTSNEVTVNVNATLTTGTVSSASICAGSTLTVPFTYTPVSPNTYYNGATFTAQLSNATGSFTSPVTIGTIAADNTGAQSISATITAATASGNAYRIRVISSSPAVTGADNGTNITISNTATAITPAAAQNINVAANGTTLTVADGDAGATHVWESATVSGGPYTAIPSQTGTTYTPFFTTPGTYYIVEVSTYGAPCSTTVTSNEVQISTSYPSCTATVSGTTGFDFSAGTASPSTSITDLTTSDFSSGNNNGTTTLITTTSASNNSGASGTFNAGAAANIGSIDLSTNTYFSFTVTPATGFAVTATALNFSSRSTSTGPTGYLIRSSIDNYASNLNTGLFVANSTWTQVNNTIAATGAVNTPVTFRIYGYGGAGNASAGTANWRVDDISLTATVTSSQMLDSAAQAAAVLPNTNATINLAGLLPSNNFTVSYNVAGGTTQTVTGTSDANGLMTMSVPVTAANGGQTLTVTNIINTTTNCIVSLGTKNTVIINILTNDYYSNAGGNLNDLTTFGSNTDGTGSNPADFTSSNKTYHITNSNTGGLSADWTVSGVGSKVVFDNNLNITGHNVSAMITVNAGQTISVASGSTLTTDDSLVLLPGARIGAVGGTITGNVVVETQFTGQRGYRLLGHPYTTDQDIATLGNYFDITGLTAGNIGVCPSTNSSIYTYTTGATPGYVGITATGVGTFPAVATSASHSNGILAFVRGTSGQGCSISDVYTPNQVTMAMSGPVNVGTITETVPAGGWNLIANPYPSQVTISGIDGSDNLDAIKVINPGGQNGGNVYTDGTAYLDASSSTVLPINGAFLAHNASGADVTLTFTESNTKSSAAPASNVLKTTSIYPTLELSVYYGNAFWDNWQMIFKPGTRNIAGDNGDLTKISNSQLNLYSLSKDNVWMNRDARDADSIADGDIVRLGLQSVPQNTYTLRVTQYDLPANKKVYLHDKYTNTYTEVDNGVSYPFSVNADAASQGQDRMELLFNDVNNTGVNNVAAQANVRIVPNPATSNITLSYTNTFAGAKQITILNTLGQVVKTINANDATVHVFVGDLASGMYMVKTISGNSITTERFIKN